MSVTESDRLANEPVLITLTDGRKAPLSFGFRALKYIEDEFGSVPALMEAFSSPENGKIYSAVLCALSAGLWRLHLSEEQLDELLNPAEFLDYLPALNIAIPRAFPQQAQTTDAKKAKSGSNGPRSTTTQPSSSDEQTNSSGS